MNCIGSGAVNKAKLARLTLTIVYEVVLGVIIGRYVAKTLSLPSIPIWRACYAIMLVFMSLSITALVVFVMVAEQRSKK